jgi:hypothetical protein
MLPQGSKPKIDKARLAAKVGEIDASMRRLSAARRGLQQALACEAPDFMACPHFQRILAAASRQPPPPAPIEIKRRPPPIPSTKRTVGGPLERNDQRKT